MRTYINGHSIGSIIDIQDEKKVKAIKRAIGTVFLTNNLLEYEPHVDLTLENLIASLKRRGPDAPFNLYEMVQHFQLDFLLRIAFNEDAGCLRQGKDVLGLTGLTYRRLQHWYAWQPAPALERFIFQNPLWSGKFTKKSRWAREGAARIEARRELIAQTPDSNGIGTPGTTGEPRDLLTKYFLASRQHPSAIPPRLLFPLVNSTIAAGTDTTVGTLAALIYYLVKHPRVRQKLLDELRSAQIARLPIRYDEVRSLPYLDAVIRETLRLLAVLGTILERTVPPGGRSLGPVRLPGGTVVGCSPYVVHRHEQTFGPEPDSFRPERWLAIDDSVREGKKKKPNNVAMERADLSWSHGSRTCLGRNLAGMEMKKLVPTLMLMFEVRKEKKIIIITLASSMRTLRRKTSLCLEANTLYIRGVFAV